MVTSTTYGKAKEDSSKHRNGMGDRPHSGIHSDMGKPWPQAHMRDNNRDYTQENSLPTLANGYVRFLHLNTGGINPKEGYAEYKVLLNNLIQTQATAYGINEHCLDTPNHK